jgi:DNA primase large subunit
MQAYGDCVNRDELCERITHPLSYYGRAVESATVGEASSDGSDAGTDV